MLIIFISLKSVQSFETCVLDMRNDKEISHYRDYNITLTIRAVASIQAVQVGA